MIYTRYSQLSDHHHFTHVGSIRTFRICRMLVFCGVNTVVIRTVCQCPILQIKVFECLYGENFSDSHFHSQLISRCLLSFYLYILLWILLRPTINPTKHMNQEVTKKKNLSDARVSSIWLLFCSFFFFACIGIHQNTHIWIKFFANLPTCHHWVRFSIHFLFLRSIFSFLTFTVCKWKLFSTLHLHLFIMLWMNSKSDSANKKNITKNRPKTYCVFSFTVFTEMKRKIRWRRNWMMGYAPIFMVFQIERRLSLMLKMRLNLFNLLRTNNRFTRFVYLNTCLGAVINSKRHCRPNLVSNFL